MTCLTFGSVCSGIEAASVAWHPLGWRAAWLAEIEPFPCAVLAHHYPEVPNLGDMTGIATQVRDGAVAAPDVFTGGTPCQAFSIAGARGSLTDARGNLTLTFCEIADAIDDVRTADGRDPCVIVWENVPGVLSTADNAFGCFLGSLSGSDGPLQPPSGAGWGRAGCVIGPRRTVAWRILDAQYFGVAQRRQRVFVVASALVGFDPVAVLFEFDGVRRDTPPSRQPWQGSAHGAARGPVERRWPADVTSTLNASFGDKQGLEDQHALSGGSLFVPAIVGTLTARGSHSLGAPEVDGGQYIPVLAEPLAASMGSSPLGHNKDDNVVAHTLRGAGFDASEDGTGRGVPLAPCTVGTMTALGNAGAGWRCGPDEAAAGYAIPVAVAFRTAGDGSSYAEGERTAPLTTGTDACANVIVQAPSAEFCTRCGEFCEADAGGTCRWCGSASDVITVDAATLEAVALPGDGRISKAPAASPVVPESLDLPLEFATDQGPTTPTAPAHPAAIASALVVRRLMPVECERLQGFPDHYTAIPWRTWQEATRKGVSYEALLHARGMTLRGPSTESCPDSPRYKALGNSWAVPCARWLGERIAQQLEAKPP